MKCRIKVRRKVVTWSRCYEGEGRSIIGGTIVLLLYTYRILQVIMLIICIIVLCTCNTCLNH